MRQLRWILTLTMCALLTSAVQMHAQPQYSVTDLGTLVPYGVNSQAMVVGEMVLNGQWGPTLWQARQFTALTSPGGGGQALGVNDTREIVGWTSNGQGSAQGAYWYQETLILLDGALPSTAMAINAGHMLADDSTVQGRYHATRWLPDGTYDEMLPTLGGRAELWECH